MTILISIDKTYGGFYIFKGFTTRICLGWIAFTVIPLNEKDYLEQVFISAAKQMKFKP